MREVLAAVGLNAALLACILLLAWLVRRRQPMTAAHLRREAAKAASPTEAPPLGGDFCRLRAMQEALEGSLPDARAAAALLLGWAAQGKIRLCQTPKKRLKSFGEDMQATLCFPVDEDIHPILPAVDGAEGLLLGLLYGWTDDTASLQASEIYNGAREYHEAVFGRLEQLAIQGKHSLRAVGAMQPEKKTRRFGFVDERRTLYTPRGVREAAALVGYRAFLAGQESLPPEYWRDAVLLDCAGGVDREQLALAEALAGALVNGARAGRKINQI